MSRTFHSLTLAILVLAGTTTSAAAAEDYAVDLAHSSITFMIQHLGISFVHGRFNDFSGNFSIDKEDPAKSSFTMTIKADSVDTNIKKRDDHLRSPEFFDVQKYPEMSFKSTSVKPMEGGFKVAGDFTMHGVTKPVSFDLKGGKTAEFPKGKHRTGFATAFILRRADYGISALPEGIANEVHVFIGFEGLKK